MRAGPQPAPQALERLLAGRHVLVPHGGERGERIASLLAKHGAAAALVPLIEQVPPRDSAPLEAAAAQLNSGAFDWVAVTSVHGAQALIAAGARPGSARVAAVGPATAAELNGAGFAVDLVPPAFTGAELAARLVDTIRAQRSPHSRVLLPLSEIAERTLEEGLRAAGLSPSRVTAYRTVPSQADPAADAELGPSLGAALVLSSSGARALVARFEPVLQTVVVAAIGEPTARELSRLGFPPAVIAPVHTASGAVDALVDYAARTINPEGHTE